MCHDPTVDSTTHQTTPRQIPLPNAASSAATPPAQSKGCRNWLLGCGCPIAVGFVIAAVVVYRWFMSAFGWFFGH